MDDYQLILESIPIRHDWISYCLAIGIGVGLIIIITILFRWKSSNSPTKILAILLLSICITILDIFLGYTGLMKYTIIANNFSESFVVLSIPLVYLLTRSIIRKNSFNFRKAYTHFIIPIIYLLYQIRQWFKPIGIKLNEYLKAYHPNLYMEHGYISSGTYHKPIFFTLAFVYLMLTGILLSRKYNSANINQFLSNDRSKIRFARNALFFTLCFLCLTIYIINIYEQDLGDHIIGLALSYIIMSTSYFLYNESRIFAPAWIADKYETAGFKTRDPLLLEKARMYILKHGFHLTSTASLKDLSAVLNVSPNLLSQKINGELHLNFNEYINQFRIVESQKRLLDSEYEHLSIEGIGQSVGFKSKSSFYTAFKKNTSMTPSVYKNSQK